MQDVPLVQDAGFVVEWQLTDHRAGGEGHPVIDLSADASGPEVVIPEDSPSSTPAG